jgi:hypothetical protein
MYFVAHHADDWIEAEHWTIMDDSVAGQDAIVESFDEKGAAEKECDRLNLEAGHYYS